MGLTKAARVTIILLNLCCFIYYDMARDEIESWVFSRAVFFPGFKLRETSKIYI